MNCRMTRLIGIVLSIVLAGTQEVWAAASPDSEGAAPANSSAAAQEKVATSIQSSQQIGRTARSEKDALPDSPGTVIAQQTTEPASQNEPPGQESQTQPQSPQKTAPAPDNSAPPQNGPSTSGTASQNAPQQPVGGAAAQLGRTTGGAASKPAGAALAPEKQRQTHSLFLKLGIIAGAGIAVGSVAALSHASPSRPPGATH